MEFEGRITKLFPISQGISKKGNQWMRLEFIFEYFETPTSRYVNRVILNARDEKISEYDLHEGDMVRIGFNHNVTEWEGRTFNTMNIYSCVKLNAAQPQSTGNLGSNRAEVQQQVSGVHGQSTGQNEVKGSWEEDEVPF